MVHRSEETHLLYEKSRKHAYWGKGLEFYVLDRNFNVSW